MAETKEEVKAQPKVYSYADLIEFENKQAFSSIGKMPISTKQTLPSYSFGSAERANQAKLYHNKELARIDFAGKGSPGPVYNVRGGDQFYYTKDANTKFGTDPRNTLNTGAKFDYYQRKDVDFEPQEADLNRKPKAANVKIGLESRFPPEKRLKGTPGPQYDPAIKPEVPTPPQFSFGYRRDIPGASALAPTCSTPVIVGPGAYLQKPPANTSNLEDASRWTIPKGPKIGKYFEGWDKNQTYDTKQIAVGVQVNSKKKSYPAFSVGKSTREAKVGHFKQLMVKVPSKVHIPHPKI
ncbi:unnamed protein product [Paramecium primaurelia]|uniref:Uncharacterized protein n=2 Tax=Paramecium TaxID=5884 RepID=A0A8S1VBU3_9CILI|nr:unnamed protein product [Paramecium primaurelia]CAD8173499.1 unnamed protein product [Paramecium pentaurelia]